MEKGEKILEKLRMEGEKLEIPEEVAPDRIGRLIKEKGKDSVDRRRRIHPAIAAAACFCLTAGIWLAQGHVQEKSALSVRERAGQENMDKGQAAVFPKEPAGPKPQETLELPAMDYSGIYARLSESWQEPVYMDAAVVRGSGLVEKEAAVEDVAGSGSLQAVSGGASVKGEAYGRTNVQTEQVEEADQVKNDGRYLYQAACKESENGTKWGIQIVDTEDGLEETAFLDGYGSVEEFYVQGGLLISIENKDAFFAAGYRDGTGVYELEDGAGRGYRETAYHEIIIYDITDRHAPKKLKTFTLQGRYETSRIYDGFFYGLSRFEAAPGAGEEDYAAYIPTLDGERLAAEKIFCPPGNRGSGYLVLVSIDLSKPLALADSRAVLSGSGICYVSRKNIYVGSYCSLYDTADEDVETQMGDKTKILKLACLKGRFYAQAEGEVPGRLNDSFSMDEYQGNLRVVSTVQSCRPRIVTDDRTGERIGVDYGEPQQTNALYILDRTLKIRGEISGLAKGEQIYSARFLGDIGYFVTFRRTDPLFAVDLSDPDAPKVQGELKVSGFSEYLHFYGTDQLLGIGMEADEESGREENMKLSMFDISDPASPSEKARLELEDYNYSEARWNHRAVLVDTEENIIGFTAEGSSKGEAWTHYLLFSFENGSFVRRLTLDACAQGGHYTVRGTFIGDRLYLLGQNGSVRCHDMQSGALLEEIP